MSDCTSTGMDEFGFRIEAVKHLNEVASALSGETEIERLKSENAALRAKLDHNANDIDQLVNETTALRTAIERIEQVWIRLPESETDLDYAICDAIDALTKEQP
jgi:DNA repair exonuclease SbcCD nuclease subunit